MNYRDWMHGYDLSDGKSTKAVNCTYEDGEIIWESALKCGVKPTVEIHCDSICEYCKGCNDSGVCAGYDCFRGLKVSVEFNPRKGA